MRALLPAVLIATAAVAPAAESLYVIEQVVVAVSSAPDASGERIATIKSGDRVEVLERVGDAVHVRLGSGRDGWVRASYLSADEPLRVRLAQREAELARLGNELSALKAQLAAPPTATTTATAAAASTAAPPVSLAAGAAAVPPPGALFSGEEERPRALWPRMLAASVIAFGFGFALGALVLDRYIRRRYGGLRIY